MTIRHILTIGLILLAGSVMAQPSGPTLSSCGTSYFVQCEVRNTVWSYWDRDQLPDGSLVNHAEFEGHFGPSSDHMQHTVFRMLRGGCLRGPAAFFDSEGNAAFTLAVGETIPAGCGRRP